MAMQLRVPAIQAQPRLRGLRSGALSPCAPTLRRVGIVRRFKENDNTEADILKRKEREEVIRKQEEALQQAAREAGKSVSSAKDELKKDVNRVVDTVERASAGKGYASAVRVPLWIPAFTRRREIFVGRIAMLGFFATCALEVMTPDHLGPIRQVQLWTDLDTAVISAIVMGILAYNTLGGLGPWSPTFSPENLRDVARRPPGPPSAMVNPFDLGRLMGVSGWGFTKRNELFHGRLAMLGFLAAFIGELRTGRGALAQLAGYLGVVPDDTYYGVVVRGFIVFTALMLALSILMPSRLQGSAAAEDEIY